MIPFEESTFAVPSPRLRDDMVVSELMALSVVMFVLLRLSVRPLDSSRKILGTNFEVSIDCNEV